MTVPRPRARVAMVVNGTVASAMGDRARAFAARLPERLAVTTIFRERGRVAAIWDMFRSLRAARPDLVYVLDIGYSGMLATTAYAATHRVPVVVDTGDAITELARSMGRGTVGVALTWALERHALRLARHVIVRGTEHEHLLASRGFRRITTIPDGVDLQQFRPGTAPTLRERLAPGAVLTLGMVGSITWSSRLRRCYGWELVETLARMPDDGIRGIVVGDGDGLPRLRARARELGVEDRVAFTGRVPLAELADYVRTMDVCLSTQTNDIPGRVRTTGKLPLYLAAGRYVLASDVGEAHLVLSETQRVPFHGTDDPEYPRRLAERVAALRRDPATIAVTRNRNRAIAAERFDYDVLANRLAQVLEAILFEPR